MPESEYYKKLVTEAVFKGYPLSLASVYVGLGDDTLFSVGSDSVIFGEVNAVGYLRQPVQWSDFIQEMSNTNVIIWDVTSAWPPVGDIFLSDSSQGGKALLYDSVEIRYFKSGDRAVFDIGNLRLT